MAPSDRLILDELVAMRGEMARMSDLMEAIIKETRDINQLLVDFLRRLISKT